MRDYVTARAVGPTHSQALTHVRTGMYWPGLRLMGTWPDSSASCHWRGPSNRSQRCIPLATGFYEWGATTRTACPPSRGQRIWMPGSELGRGKRVRCWDRIHRMWWLRTRSVRERMAAPSTHRKITMSDWSSRSGPVNEAIAYDDREVSNQQHRSGTDFKNSNSIHLSLSVRSWRGV